MDQTTANEESSGGKAPLILDGKTYLCDQTSDYYSACFSKWVRGRQRPPEQAKSFAELVSDPGFEKLSPKLQELAVKETVRSKNDAKKVSKIEQIQQDVADASWTDEGCAYLIWLHIRANHPDVKHGDLIPVIAKITPEYGLMLLNKAAAFPKSKDDPEKN